MQYSLYHLQCCTVVMRKMTNHHWAVVCETVQYLSWSFSSKVVALSADAELIHCYIWQFLPQHCKCTAYQMALHSIAVQNICRSWVSLIHMDTLMRLYEQVRLRIHFAIIKLLNWWNDEPDVGALWPARVMQTALITTRRPLINHWYNIFLDDKLLAFFFLCVY